MHKGIVFTIGAAYVILIVFSAIIVLIGSMHAATAPNYDTIQAMKVAHDMGENRTDAAPAGYALSSCSHAYASLSYYNMEVCMR